MGLKPNKMFDDIMSIVILLFSLAGIIAFWIFIREGNVYDHWYPLIGHFVAAHGAFIGIILHEYLKSTGKSLKYLFKKKK